MISPVMTRINTLPGGYRKVLSHSPISSSYLKAMELRHGEYPVLFAFFRDILLKCQSLQLP